MPQSTLASVLATGQDRCDCRLWRVLLPCAFHLPAGRQQYLQTISLVLVPAAPWLIWHYLFAYSLTEIQRVQSCHSAPRLALFHHFPPIL